MPDYRPDRDHEAALTSTARHVLITAPPGTGKTCLSVRLAAQVARSVESDQRILLLTFSNQARTQLEREAAGGLTRELRRRVHITNYHSFFWYSVRAYRRALRLPMDLDIGSTRRRAEALSEAEPVLARALAEHEGMIESLAEHSFPEFRDSRTPDEEQLARLLSVVHREHREGRLVFDDLGALFWELLTRFPSVDAVYKRRYPVVIADEHQDASALQDAVARRLGRERLIILADEMQLIHEFRGADRARLKQHSREGATQLTLRTPHRWHDSRSFGEWLVAVRERLQGGGRSLQLPETVQVERTPAEHGATGMKPIVRSAVSQAFRDGAATVAVIARANDQVSDLRSYLCRKKQYPHQIGTQDFEEARHDIEQLPLHRDQQTIAHHAVDRLQALVPTLSTPVVDQLRRRLLSDDVNVSRAGAEASSILNALEPIYTEGPRAYFASLVAALTACRDSGHHLPRTEAVRALRMTADATLDDPVTFDAVIARYAEAVLEAAQVAPRMENGLFLMTAHQAKGKEFDGVVLADLSARFWPDHEESRRLFYVAVTRAARSLTLVAPDRRASPILRLCTG